MLLPSRAAVVQLDPTPPGSSATASGSAPPGASSPRGSRPARSAYLRKGGTFAELAAGSASGTANAWRPSPRPWPCSPAQSRSSAGLAKVKDAGQPAWSLTVPDTIDWVAADRPLYSGKHHRQEWTCRSSPVPTGTSRGVRAAARRGG